MRTVFEALQLLALYSLIEVRLGRFDIVHKHRQIVPVLFLRIHVVGRGDFVLESLPILNTRVLSGWVQNISGSDRGAVVVAAEVETQDGKSLALQHPWPGRPSVLRAEAAHFVQ